MEIVAFPFEIQCFAANACFDWGGRWVTLGVTAAYFRMWLCMFLPHDCLHVEFDGLCSPVAVK